MDNIAIIIARGGSRRLPRKNVLPFCGHPLVAWSVVQALSSRLVDEVYLSTDDEEIAEIGSTYGAEIIIRPDWPDADEVSAYRVYRHAIDYLEPIHGDDYTMMQLFPTSPVRHPQDIDSGLRFWQTIGGQGHLVAAAPKRETVLHERVLPGLCRTVIIDKSYRYLDRNSGLINVASTRWYRWINAELSSDHDEDINKKFEAGTHPEKDFYYVECQPYQTIEADTEIEFRMAELIMREFVLQGRGIEIYEEYRNA